MMTYIGVGVSYKTLDLARWTGAAVETIDQFSNDLTGFGDIAERLSKVVGPGPLCLVLEATGSYHLSLVAFAAEQGWQVALPNPKRVKELGQRDGLSD